MRWIVIVLVILNIAAFVWFVRTSPAAVPTVSAVPADVPALVLLREVGAPEQAAAPLATTSSANAPDNVSSGPASPAPSDSSDSSVAAGAAAVAGSCFDLGPFPATEDVDAFTRSFGTAFVLSVDRRPRQIRTNYRVYLPPATDRQSAQQSFEELRSRMAGAQLDFDNFLITRGELENGIALGLFSDQRNAENVETRLAALGYDVVIAEEPVYQDELWIRLVERAGGAAMNNMWTQMQAGRPWLQRIEKLC